MRSKALLLAVLALGACFGGPHSPYLRIYAENGRAYYARVDRALHSDSGGFLTFRDLVTKEQVRLRNGTYQALECPREEVKRRQIEYLNDPARPPRVEDYSDR